MADPDLIQPSPDLDGDAFHYQHPLDDAARVTMVALSRRAGLARAAVSLVRLDPGQHSFPKHAHHAEEEWIYILSGTAVLTLGDDIHQLGPGAFAGFPAGGPAHLLENRSDGPVEYLMGGENRETEIVDFPDLNKRLVRSGGVNRIETAPLDGFSGYDPMAAVKLPENF